MPSEWIGKTEAAAILGCDPTYLNQALRRGYLETHRQVKRAYEYDRAEVEAYAQKKRERAGGRVRRPYMRETFRPEEKCCRCEIVLARDTPSAQDPTLCQDCWDRTHPKPKAVAWPVEIVNPAYLRR